MQDSIFTKIIKGEVPCHKIYEDERTIAFLDIHPVQPGMTLVVSKKQVETFLDLSDDDYIAFFATVKRVGQRLKEVFSDKIRVSVQIEGLDVPHVHAKLFAINTGDQFRAKQDTTSEPNHDELAKIAEKIAIK